MSNWRGKLVWLIPVLIVIIGVSLLFIQNYQKVTEPPDDQWSRHLQVGETPVLRAPNVKMEADSPSISYLTSNGVQQNQYDKDYNLMQQNSYTFPVDKFTDFYIDKHGLIYADYYTLYNGDNEEKITDIQQFFPLEDSVFYRKDDTLYSLKTDTLKSTELFKIENSNSILNIEETSSGIFLLTNTAGTGGNQLNFYKLEDGEVNKVGETVISVRSSEEIRDIQFSILDNTYKLLITTLQKQSASGKMQNYYYYSESDFGEQPKLNPVNFDDPFSNQQLREVTDLSMEATDTGATLLFKAIGTTETQFREPEQFNIYQSELQQNGQKEVTRLSNTPDLSNYPTRIDQETVVWVDLGGDKHNILLASKRPNVIEKADEVTQPAIMHSLGKTMGMLSTGLFTLIIATFWWLWPLIFIVILMFSKKDALDEDRSWVLFSGIAIYMAAAILVREPIFSERLLSRAPDYLSFPGSPIIFLMLFGLLAYGILKTGARIRDWSTTIQLTYFISMHILFVTIFFGPYVL